MDMILLLHLDKENQIKKYDITIDGEWGKIIVPQGKPIDTGIKSTFYNSEYLVYQESQVRMKYLLMFEWD